ncbi:MAG: hypothetical protein RMA76_42790 [Deltaproteobacteria bacterium]|jgi:hypothetical protein
MRRPNHHRRMHERPPPTSLPDPAVVGRICVQAVLATSAARYIDKYRLGELVRRHVVDRLKERRVDFTEVLRGLLEIENVTEEDLYVGLVNMIECLRGIGVEMRMPPMTLDEPSRARILDAGHAATHSARSAFELRRLRAVSHRDGSVRLGEMLVQGHHITQAQLDQALEAQKLHGRRLGSNLVEMGFITASGLARFLGRQLGMPSVTRIDDVDEAVLRRVPKDIVRRLRVFPLAIDEDGHLELAMEDPLDVDAVRVVERLTGLKIRPVVAPESTLTYAMSRFYGQLQPARVRSG